MKTRKLEKEVFDLKSKLLNKQWDLIGEIETKFQTTLTVFKSEADKRLELYKKENEKIVTSIQYDFNILTEKINKVIKTK
jgi:hypothetical protein